MKLNAGVGWLVRAACALACLAAVMAFAPSAHASACAWGPVCPFQGVQALGNSDPASLDGPLAAAWSRDGNVVVADESHGTVREFSPSGVLLRRLDEHQHFVHLTGLAIDPDIGLIYLMDGGCIRWLGPRGYRRGKWCTSTHFDTESILAGPGGTVYALFNDLSTQWIDVIGPDRHLVRTFAVPETSTGEFAVDGRGTVYLGDQNSVLRYDTEGHSLGSLQLPIDAQSLAIYGPTLYATASPDSGASGTGSKVYAFDLLGHQRSVHGLDPGTQQITVGPSGALAVTTGGQIEIASLDGTHRSVWGGLAPDDYVPAGVFGRPGSDDFYVVDTLNTRILRYSANGGPPTVFATLPGAGYGGNAPGISYAGTDAHGDPVIYTGLDSVITLNWKGQVLRQVALACSPGCTKVAVARNTGDIYASDWIYTDKFAPDGKLLARWRLYDPDPTVDANGDFFLARDPRIVEFNSDGQRMFRWPAYRALNAPADGTLTVAPGGLIYAAVGHEVDVYSPTGRWLSAWRFPSDQPEDISVTPDGEAFVSVFNDPSGAPRVRPSLYRYYAFRRPLPPPPYGERNPLARYMHLVFVSPSQNDSGAVTTDLICSVSARLVSYNGQPPFPGAGCSGTLSITAPDAGSVSWLLGQTRFSLPLGPSAARPTIHLNSRARHLLAHNGRLRATLTATYEAGPLWKTVSRQIVLRRHP